MTKTDFLKKFRRCSSYEILEKVAKHKRECVPVDFRSSFEGAFDHRKAEIRMQRSYDRIPPEVWRFIN
ncbi:Hha/YmoA family nucleoid-associated regulatory protein (plasmid) [Pantoea sp. BJ2]|uniref:Hha/YmoA family nucleoid-associated regulatory protein n=1 Tax=Pantoea sp. BJ2 TaxID=3141322 RepID=A0AAU7U521_9GAMM